MQSAQLSEALPQGFDFYHLGRIELQPARPAPMEPTPRRGDRMHFGIGYRIEGELRGVFLLLVPQGLDTSVYAEAGNIIASRMVTELGARHKVECTLSPPRVLNPVQLDLLLQNSIDSETRFQTYHHRANPSEAAAEPILLQAALLPASAPLQENTGHA